jgi:hypothetical protein
MYLSFTPSVLSALSVLEYAQVGPPQIYFFHWAQKCLNWPPGRVANKITCIALVSIILHLFMILICSDKVLSISVSTTLVTTHLGLRTLPEHGGHSP